MGQMGREDPRWCIYRGRGATLLAPESMGRFARWFANNLLYMRLDAIAVIGLGVFLP